jgi:hypothetical protein
MSQRLEDRVKELCVKATSTPDSPEFNELLKPLKDALRDIPTESRDTVTWNQARTERRSRK